jgi:hypothetical protein
MTKQELIDKIKSIARNKYKKQITFVSGIKFTAVRAFPKLHDILVDLMTDAYEIFVTDVQWVAPKPTTFKIQLVNGEHFFLTNTDRTWIATIEGKKFYLLNLSEKQDAINAIARVLRYGTTKKGTEGTQGTEAGTEEIPAEAPPAEETPEELPPA